MNAAAAQEGARLAACYRAIGRERMAGLPICNPALAVAAVGFSALAGETFGALVTPWCLNLVLLDLPGVPPRPALAAGAIRACDFPSGTIDYTVTVLAGFGRVDTASLFSPMHQFASQEVAEATALAALAAVLTPPQREIPGRRGLLFGRGAVA